MTRLFRLLFLSILPLLPTFALADSCSVALGTYLNSKKDISGVDKGVTGRTTLSLAKDGLAIMTDSAQGGIEGYQAFGMMQGTWRCVEGDATGAKISATMLDFSYPNESDSDAHIARVELSGTVTVETGQISGEVNVYIYKLSDDPFSDVPPASSVDYVFDGKHVLSLPGSS
ncbi:MAG: hypothetical protein AAGF94_03940 [Pseudomonadota bacterium]